MAKTSGGRNVRGFREIVDVLGMLRGADTNHFPWPLVPKKTVGSENNSRGIAFREIGTEVTAPNSCMRIFYVDRESGTCLEAWQSLSPLG